MPNRSRLPLAAAAIVALLAAGAIGWALRGPGKSSAPAVPVGLYPQPTRLDHGVPVGWPHTQAGAVAAARAYARAIVDPRFLTSKSYRAQVLHVTSTPSFASNFEARYGDALARYARQVPFARDFVRGVKTLFFETTLAYDVQSYRPAAASVRTWTVGVVGNASSRPPVAIWETKVFGLTWSSNDWKLASASPPTNGPVPRLEDTPTAPAALLARVDGMQETSDVP